MSGLNELIHEQLLEYSEQLKEVEKEIVRKYRAGENCDTDVQKAVGLKRLQEQCVIMLADKNRK